MKKKNYLLVLFAIGLQFQIMANTISGKITDLSDKASVEGVSVYLYNTDFIESTDANGEFTFDSVPLGTYAVIIDHPNYVQQVITDFKVTDGTNLIEMLNENSLLVNCYPNPFMDNLTVDFSISETQRITIDILNVKGQVLEVLDDNYFIQGKHSVVWDGNISGLGNITGNIYYCRIRGAKFSQTIKIIKIN